MFKANVLARLYKLHEATFIPENNSQASLMHSQSSMISGNSQIKQQLLGKVPDPWNLLANSTLVLMYSRVAFVHDFYRVGRLLKMSEFCKLKEIFDEMERNNGNSAKDLIISEVETRMNQLIKTITDRRKSKEIRGVLSTLGFGLTVDLVKRSDLYSVENELTLIDILYEGQVLFNREKFSEAETLFNKAEDLFKIVSKFDPKAKNTNEIPQGLIILVEKTYNEGADNLNILSEISHRAEKIIDKRYKVLEEVIYLSKSVTALVQGKFRELLNYNVPICTSRNGRYWVEEFSHRTVMYEQLKKKSVVEAINEVLKYEAEFKKKNIKNPLFKQQFREHLPDFGMKIASGKEMLRLGCLYEAMNKFREVSKNYAVMKRSCLEKVEERKK